ncbi:MAG TPA: glycosyltransferase family 39 protein [Candidatus Kapabacteria bacterium]|nr:glycosyltransferase family 39 protein [Candidatus Kapabacteria bacterium]
MSIAQIFQRTEVKLFLLGIAVRLLFVALFPGINYYDGITKEYLNAAGNLLHGHGLNVFVDIAPWNSGQTHFAYQPFIDRPIGYVLFCAFVGLIFGLSPIALQVVQAIVTALSVILIYRLALELFAKSERQKKIAMYAALLAAVWPNQARFEIALLPDGLTTLIILGLALELTRFIKTLEWKYLTRAGVILACSIFFRPDLVLFPAFFFMASFALLPKLDVIRAALILVAMLAVTVGLNTWMHYRMSGEIVPLNLGSGTTMYEGISQFGDTLGTTYADERLAHNVFNTKELFYPNGVQNDRSVWQTAVDTIEHHPGFYATVVLRRIPLMFTVRGLYFSDTVSLANPNNDLAKRFPRKYILMFKDHPIQASVRLLSPIFGWLIIIAGFWGLLQSWRKHKRDHFMVALLLFYFISTHLLTNVEPRYFYPAVPLLYGYAVITILKFKNPLSSQKEG